MPSRAATQEAEDVGLVGHEPSRTADLDHLVVEIEPARRHAGLAQEVEELAASTADVEHVARAGESGR